MVVLREFWFRYFRLHFPPSLSVSLSRQLVELAVLLSENLSPGALFLGVPVLTAVATTSSANFYHFVVEGGLRELAHVLRPMLSFAFPRLGPVLFFLGTTNRQVSGRTALHTEEQKFDLMYEQLNDLKNGKSVMKPIYNHVNGTLDTPEEIKPTPIVIIEGLHPFVDERVRELLDFTIYLDISDEIKFAWKIQRDMMERGHSLESIQASIEVRRVCMTPSLA